MASSVRSFNSGLSTVLPYTPSVSSANGGDGASNTNHPNRSCEIHPFFLWFYKDEKLERQFRIFYADRQLQTLQRLYLALTTIAAVVLGFQISYASENNVGGVAACASLIILCPIFLLGLSHTRFFRLYFSVGSLLAGVITIVCFIRITVWNGRLTNSVTIVVYLFCLFSFLMGLHFPEVVCLHVFLIVYTMIEWTAADMFQDTGETISILIQFACTATLFAYAAYRQDYIYRRVFLSTYQLKTDNKDLRFELDKLRLGENRSLELDIESPIIKIIATLKEVRQVFSVDSMEKEAVGRLDAVIDLLTHSPDIFSPNLSSQIANGRVQVDGDVQNWLFSELASRESRANSTVGDIPSRRPSLGGILKRRRSSSGMKGLGLPFPLRPSSEVSEMNSDVLYSITSFLETHADQWDFDVFLFAEKCNGRPLFHMANYLFKRHQLLTKFDIDPVKFENFLNLIESGYHPDNPYHNSTHATDVLQGCHQLITCSDLISSMDDIELFALFLAAIVHDVDHPGRTNIFMINTESEFALTYNDKSVLENHHSSTAFRVLRDPKSNILENMSKPDRKALRANVIDLILSTDLSMHFDIVGKFKSKIDADDLRTVKENRAMILKIVIKCADVSNPAKIEALYLPWVQRIMTEFYVQGDEEAKLSLPISPFMDRNTPTVEKCQCGFMDFIVRPLFDGWCAFTKDQSWAQILDANKKYFAAKLAASNPAPAPAPAPTPAPAPAPPASLPTESASKEAPRDSATIVTPAALSQSESPSTLHSKAPSERDLVTSVPSTPPAPQINLPSSIPSHDTK